MAVVTLSGTVGQRMEGELDPARRNQFVVAAFAGVIVLVLVFAFAGGGGSGGEDPPVTTSDAALGGSSESVPFTLVPSASDSDVTKLECFPLLPVEAVEEALGVADRPEDERGLFGSGQGETCRRVLVADERFVVGISPAELGDFLSGALILGVEGVGVPDVGEGSLWFGGEEAEGSGNLGLLVVRESTELGELSFRLGLGRPDLDTDAQLEVVKRLASRVLLQFPGVVPPPAPVPVDVDFEAAFDEVEVDRSAISFVDNLLAKEEAGEWTLGEGLVATLKLFAGEVDVTDVLRHPEVLSKEGTGIVAMAYEYLEDGPDTDAQAEIARLLDLLVFSNEQLEAMAGIVPVADADAEAEAEASSPAVVRVSLPTVQSVTQQAVQACQGFFNEDVYGSAGPGVGACLEWRPANVAPGLEGKYRVFIPASPLPQGGWTEDHYDLALTALEHSARWYEGEGRRLALAAGAEGKMPSVNLVFAIYRGGGNLAVATPVAGRSCGVVLYQSLQRETANNFEQTIAHELAHCFQTENFPKQNDPFKVKYKFRAWREEGLADYLSGVVYPQNNFEWASLPDTARISKGTTLLDLSYGNFLFFQYLEEQIGIEGIFHLVTRLPTSGDEKAQEEKLAAYPDMKSLFHEYLEAMIDGVVEDTGGGLVGKPPYKMEYGTKAITGTGEATLDLRPFGVGRIQFTIEECKEADLNVDRGMAMDSARPTADQDWAFFPTRFPETRGDDHDRIYAISTKEDEEVTVEVTDFRDDPECETDFGPPPPPNPCDVFCSPSDYYRSATNPILLP